MTKKIKLLTRGVFETKLYDFICKLDVHVCAHPIYIDYIYTCTRAHTLLRLSDIAVSARDQMNSIVDIGC